MAPDFVVRVAAALLPVVAAVGLMQGCAAPSAAPAAPAAAPSTTPATRTANDAPAWVPPAAVAPVAAPQAPPQRSPAAAPPAAPAAAVASLLAYADRLRPFNAIELGLEITRLGDGGASAAQQMQLALALLQTQLTSDGQRAQALLQRVLSTDTPEALPLHPLARLLSALHASQRKVEEQAERQAQQLRDSQRRIDQLSDRLDALRAIERSLPSRPVR